MKVLIPIIIGLLIAGCATPDSNVTEKAPAETPALPNTLMNNPGELIFSEDFDPESVSNRWGFKANFALRDGALLRTEVDSTETKRVFLKDPSFHNTIIQFDLSLIHISEPTRPY